MINVLRIKIKVYNTDLRVHWPIWRTKIATVISKLIGKRKHLSYLN